MPMLSFFPMPYPDELLYSVITRYHIRSGNRRFKQTLSELIGYYPQQPLSYLLPTNLEFFVSSLPIASKYTVDDFLYINTLYPFYKSFLKPLEIFDLQKRMRVKSGKPISALAKVHIDKGKYPQKIDLRYCYECWKSDIEQYGEGYWHRMHQIPGILVCLKHQTCLHSNSFSLREIYTNCCVIKPDRDITNLELVHYLHRTIQPLLSIAKEISWLCASTSDFKGLKWLRNQYQYYLSQGGFVKRKKPGKLFFKEKEFTESIISFYGEEFLNVMNLNLDAHLGRHFSRTLFSCDVELNINRLMHILLIKFLLKSLKNIF